MVNSETANIGLVLWLAGVGSLAGFGVALCGAAWDLARAPKDRPVFGEWLFPLRGRWLRYAFATLLGGAGLLIGLPSLALLLFTLVSVAGRR
jgi:hypothetical protein